MRMASPYIKVHFVMLSLLGTVGYPSTCTCGKSFTVEHALSCSLGGFPSIRHNEIRDLTANLMTEVCHNVSIEPHLQPITGETFPAMTANTEDGARSDIAADGFWGGRFERTFFDVRVFNPYAPSNQTPTPSSCYQNMKTLKRENTKLEFSELHSLQLFSLQQEAWVALPLPPTNVWHHC